MTQLLAKRTPCNGKPKTLVEHTRDVVDADITLFGTAEMPTRLARAWLRFFRLDADDDMAAFHANRLAACLFHDWGKANADMQNIFEGGSGQMFRHEHLSVLLLGYAGVQKWVRQRADVDWDACSPLSDHTT